MQPTLKLNRADLTVDLYYITNNQLRVLSFNCMDRFNADNNRAFLIKLIQTRDYDPRWDIFSISQKNCLIYKHDHFVLMKGDDFVLTNAKNFSLYEDGSIIFKHGDFALTGRGFYDLPSSLNDNIIKILALTNQPNLMGDDCIDHNRQQYLKAFDDLVKNINKIKNN